MIDFIQIQCTNLCLSLLLLFFQNSYCFVYNCDITEENQLQTYAIDGYSVYKLEREIKQDLTLGSKNMLFFEFFFMLFVCLVTSLLLVEE